MKNGGKTTQNKESLSYEGVLVWDLVKKDTDLDGIPDWEESLYGTDINKKDTNDDGVPDSQEIEKRRILEGGDEKDLTETEKFSRELFATIATLNQAGPIDQNTADKLSVSLVEKIQNPEIRKTYQLSDIKVTEDNSLKSIQQYKNNLSAIYKKYPLNEDIISIFKEFLNDGEEIKISALKKLDPIIIQIQGIINERLKINTPSDFVSLHLETINAFERLNENLIDIKLYDTDPIIAMGAISKYEENSNLLQETVINLANKLQQRLKS